MSDERLEILLTESYVSDVRSVREFVGIAPAPRATVVATATPKNARVTKPSTEDTSPATTARRQTRFIGRAFHPSSRRSRTTRLGLSISHGLVRDRGARMTVGSVPDGGPRFFVDLPLDTG